MASTVYTEQDAAYWYVPLVRAVPAAGLALAITFSQGNYSPLLGLIAFGVFAVVSGVLGGVLSLRALPRGVNRTIFLVQAIVSIVAGATALLGSSAGLPLFLVLVGSWATISGCLELYAGLRSRRLLAAARDWVFIGIVTAVFAVVTFVIPPDFVQHYVAPDDTKRILNTSVMVVGLLSVYGAITAVYLVIAALSLKWGPASAPRKGAAS
jgi:hypothetical protein